ncbi:dihydroorotate dehydrogenase electron transfer subunit [Candidatus Woesearchaeota archaeon]|nr:dihydroorotate dehydrogenase electron transfer subunit [Candidatus Woesearchaeota archaeon]
MNKCGLRNDIPQIYEVSRVEKEGKDLFTVFLKGQFLCKPGQFVMVWLPRVDEKPMAVSYLGKDEFGFTFHTLGTFTQECSKVKKGDKIGIRGPYGNWFSQEKNSVIVGGGVGLSSVSTLIDGMKATVIHGARDKDHLLYTKRFKDMIICTDDGSAGTKGFVTLALEEVLEKKRTKKVYCCGPEIMMKKVLELCNKYHVDCEASLERYMKCGFGVCGACMIDDKVVCKEGPIFSSKELNTMKEFGEYARIKTGRKVTLQEYSAWRG